MPLPMLIHDQDELLTLNSNDQPLLENTEPTETLMVVSGTNVNFDTDGNFVGMLAANSIMLAIDALVRERKLDPAKYIAPPQSSYTAAGYA